MNNGFRIVFMGTPAFAVKSLDTLITNKINVVGVVTVPDKPAGRGKKLATSAVKDYAIEKNLKILQPYKLKDSEFISQLKKLDPDIIVVVAFRMIPEIIWQMPKHGSFNLHASLLPDYRGAAPINWAIIRGETKTGVTTFFINNEIDAGKILFQEEVQIFENETAGDLHDKLMNIGALLVLKTIYAIKSGKFVETKQMLNLTGKLKTAPKIFKENCKINWNVEGKNIYNFIRGLSPFPGAWTIISNENNKQFLLKIFSSRLIFEKHDSPIGTILSDESSFLRIALKDNNILELLNIQLEGKKRLMINEFLRGIQSVKKWHLIL